MPWKVLLIIWHKMFSWNYHACKLCSLHIWKQFKILPLQKQKRGDYQVSGNHYANYAHRLLTTNVIVHAEYF